MIVYDKAGIKVRICPDDFLRISVWGKYVFVTPEELAGIGEAVARHLEKPFFTEEDLKAGCQAIAEPLEGAQ